MKQTHRRALTALVLAVIGLAASAGFRPQTKADTTAMSVYPVNSRMSFRGKLDAGNTAASTMAIIKTGYSDANAVYSTSSALLQTGDTVRIGDGDYQVSFSSSALTDAQIALRTPLRDGDTAADTAVYATMSADIKVVFKAHEKDSASTIDSAHPGRIEILVPASPEFGTGDTQYVHYLSTADGLPDSGGFDFGAESPATITAADTSKFSNCTATSAKQAATMIGATPYHKFTCEYTSALEADHEYAFTITNLINPAPKAQFEEDGHTVAAGRSIGSADAYAIRGYQYEYGAGGVATSYSAIREAITYVGFSNGVKMTVRVMPQLTFKIQGIEKGTGETLACGGLPIDVSSTAYDVDFGAIGNTYFTRAAQKFSVTTNAPHGYVITAIADDQMRLAGQTCPQDGSGYSYCIPSPVDKLTPSAWVQGDPATGYNSGFGYTLHVVSGDNYLNTAGNYNVQAAFDYADNQYWRQFADTQMHDDAVQLFNNLRSTSSDELEVCYQIMSNSANVPGDYISTLTYTVTASF